MRWIAVIATLALLGACTPSENASPTPSPTSAESTTSPMPSPSPSPSPSPTAVQSFPSDLPTEDDESAAIIAGWQAYVAAIDAHYKAPELTDYSDLERVTNSTELARAVGEIGRIRDLGIRRTGDAVYRDVTVGAVESGEDGDPTAELRYCFDPTHQQVVDEAGDPYDSAASATMSGTATLVRWADGAWRVSKISSEVASC